MTWTSLVKTMSLLTLHSGAPDMVVFGFWTEAEVLQEMTPRWCSLSVL